MRFRAINYRRAIPFGVLIYLLTLLVSVLVALIIGVDFSRGELAPPLVGIISIIFSFILGVGFSYWYFKFKDVEQETSLQSGFMLGLVFAIINVLVEFVFVYPFIILSGNPVVVSAYDSLRYFWIHIVIVVVSCSIYGYALDKDMFRRKKRH